MPHRGKRCLVSSHKVPQCSPRGFNLDAHVALNVLNLISFHFLRGYLKQWKGRAKEREEKELFPDWNYQLNIRTQLKFGRFFSNSQMGSERPFLNWIGCSYFCLGFLLKRGDITYGHISAWICKPFNGIHFHFLLLWPSQDYGILDIIREYASSSTIEP